MTNEAQGVFERIYTDNLWKGSSRSGPGSSLEATKLVRAGLIEALNRFEIRTLIDAPCGDAQWIRQIAESLRYYLGYDIVRELIGANAQGELPHNMFFRCADIRTAKFPQADAILCRDCLVHFPLEDAKAAIANFRASGANILIATTFTETTENRDIAMGGWRMLNLAIAPFDLGPPIMTLRERQPNLNDRYNDKSLGFWAL